MTDRVEMKWHVGEMGVGEMGVSVQMLTEGGTARDGTDQGKGV